jgi:hypothetical protein
MLNQPWHRREAFLSSTSLGSAGGGESRVRLIKPLLFLDSTKIEPFIFAKEQKKESRKRPTRTRTWARHLSIHSSRPREEVFLTLLIVFERMKKIEELLFIFPIRVTQLLYIMSTRS